MPYAVVSCYRIMAHGTAAWHAPSDAGPDAASQHRKCKRLQRSRRSGASRSPWSCGCVLSSVARTLPTDNQPSSKAGRRYLAGPRNRPTAAARPRSGCWCNRGRSRVRKLVSEIGSAGHIVRRANVVSGRRRRIAASAIPAQRYQRYHAPPCAAQRHGRNLALPIRQRRWHDDRPRRSWPLQATALRRSRRLPSRVQLGAAGRQGPRCSSSGSACFVTRRTAYAARCGLGCVCGGRSAMLATR